MIFRAAIVTLAALGLFWFPWPLALILIVVAGVVMPIAALVLGVTADLLFHPFAPGVMPYGIIIGIVMFALGSVLRRFFASRIMGA